MDTWTLKKAKNGFSELVRRALAHQPQRVTRGGRAGEALPRAGSPRWNGEAPPRRPIGSLWPMARELGRIPCRIAR